jgi:hypothetical protein
MPRDFEHHETTLVWDYPDSQVELYTTDRRVFLRCLARNPNFIAAQELKPGYRLVYDVKQLRTPDMVIRSAPGGDEVVDRFLTDAERTNRAAAAERLQRQRANSRLANADVL